MKNSIDRISSLIIKYRFIFVFILVLFCWFPVLFIPFINDDYQILGFHINKGITSLFQPFWSPDVSQYYWRPVGNLIHPLILLIGGFNPVNFRIVSFLIYFLCCITMMIALEKSGIGKIISFTAIIIFAVLPSHELQVAWIADQGEALFTIFLILAFLYYYKAVNFSSVRKYLPALFFFFIAILIKETAFAGIFIPLIILVIKGQTDKKIIRKVIYHSLIAILVVAVVLTYRFFIIGGTPVNPVHFADINPLHWLVNFFIYIPLAFVPPETLEWLQYEIKNWWLILLLLMTVSLFLYLLFKNYKSLKPDKKRILFAGLFWFIIFIIPALPNLMRWYVFSASFGLVIIIAVYMEKIVLNLRKKKYFYLLIIVLVIVISFYDFNLMLRWNKAGEKLHNALTDLKEKKDIIKTDSLIVWAVPDKLDRIPMMKLGVMETIQWTLNNKNISVLAPLRVELVDLNSRIRLVSFNDSLLILKVNGGRFLQERGVSKSILTNTFKAYNYEGNDYEIDTKVNQSGVPDSKVTIKIGDKNLEGKDQLFFNGSKFVKIN
jgi:hypothetical protein